jgi:hypothetical protein
MTIRITVDAPDELGHELARVQDRLVEVLERGLREVLADDFNPDDQDERRIMAVLASQASPDEVLALRPSTAMQARASQLLASSKEGRLSAREAVELERYLMLEHLVRLAKGHAYKRRQTNP